MAMKLYEENDVQNIANAIRAKQTPPLISKWLEYIEPAGEEPYFNTGYIPTDTTGIKLEVKYNETINDRVSVGVRENQGNTRFFIAVSDGYGYWGWNTYTSTNPTNPGYGPAIDTTSKHIISMNYLNNRKHICDNTEYFTITDTLAKITRPIFIFRFNRSGKPGSCADMKLYSLEITEGNSVVKRFVPVLDTNNIPCLYEEINKVLYYNAGGGSFNYKEKETQRYTVSQMASAINEIENLVNENKFLANYLTNSVNKDLDITIPEGQDLKNIREYVSNNYDLILRGKFKYNPGSSGSLNLGTGMLSAPDVTGAGCGNYFFSGFTAKRLYLPNLEHIDGTVIFNGSVIQYYYLPKLDKLSGNYDLTGNNKANTWYFPVMEQFGVGQTNMFGSSNVKNLIIGTSDCTLNNANTLSRLNSNNGNVFVPTDYVTTYQNATNWSTHSSIIKGYTENTETVGQTITLNGGDTYELLVLWYETQETCAKLSGNQLTFNDKGIVFIKKYNSSNECVGGEIYHIEQGE